MQLVNINLNVFSYGAVQISAECMWLSAPFGQGRIQGGGEGGDRPPQDWCKKNFFCWKKVH